MELRGLPLSSEDSISGHLERTPELEEARLAGLMAHNFVIKLKEMGLPDEMDGPLSQMCTDLGHLWGAQGDLARQMEAFLKSPSEWGAAGDCLVDLNATIEHIAWHMKGVREPMERITEWAYDQTEA